MNQVRNIQKSIFKTFVNFSNRKKLQFLFIFFLNILTGYVEFLTIGAVGIFIASITSSETIVKSKGVNLFFQLLGAKDTNELVLPTLIIFIIILFLSTIIRLTNLWLNTKFRVSFIKEISTKAFKKVLNQNYEYHLNKNSSELISDLTTHVDKSVGFIDQLLYIFYNIFISIGIISAIFIVNVRLTFTVSLIIGSLYLIFTLYINKKISSYSKLEVKANQELVQTLQEGLGSIKNIILENNQNFHTSKFGKSVGISRKYQGIVSLYAQSPKFVIEALGFSVIALIGYSISTNQNNLNGLAFLGSFALGAQKLLPAIQNIYSSWTNLISYNKGYEKILSLLDLKNEKPINQIKTRRYRGPIIIQNISYRYPKSNKNSLNDISLTINRGEKIGLMGKTGSGKTTLINILMGLLKPSKGDIIADNINIFDRKNINSLIQWRQRIGHVPQKIFLSDSTILENIALFENKGEINFSKAKSAANTACILEYINSTKNNFYTTVGEQGISLSGGQVQRLGIARALYKELDILILDEATSALDNLTESLLMDNISKYSKDLTIIIIAHRLKTLEICDRVVDFKNGKISRIITGQKLKSENKNII
tara:strand:- start:6545 stop:8332 length:1788 start_codon:yes stop_codon:yes gene_type:complete